MCTHWIARSPVCVVTDRAAPLAASLASAAYLADGAAAPAEAVPIECAVRWALFHFSVFAFAAVLQRIRQSAETNTLMDLIRACGCGCRCGCIYIISIKI